jgi:hypothetical protein
LSTPISKEPAEVYSAEAFAKGGDGRLLFFELLACCFLR